MKVGMIDEVKDENIAFLNTKDGKAYVGVNDEKTNKCCLFLLKWK